MKVQIDYKIQKMTREESSACILKYFHNHKPVDFLLFKVIPINTNSRKQGLLYACHIILVPTKMMLREDEGC